MKNYLKTWLYTYLLLFMLPFPLGAFADIQAYEDLWLSLYNVLNPVLLHWPLADHLQRQQSGDTVVDYFRCLTLLLLSAPLAGLVSAKIPQARWQPWARLLLRLYLATAMITYGMYKIFPSQFPTPSPMRLVSPIGQMSPMGLLWTFMGYSKPYIIFGGISEVLGGLLLLFRRTSTLGALVVVTVMSNVVMLNFSYDVCVKIGSFHYLVLALLMLAPHGRRLWQFFVLHQSIVLEQEPLPSGQPRLEKTLPSVLAVFGILLVFVWAAKGYEGLHNRQKAIDETDYYGLWRVDEAHSDSRLSRVIFDTGARVSFQKDDGTFDRFTIEKKDENNYVLKGLDDHKQSALHIESLGENQLRLNTEKNQWHVHRENELTFPLLQRGFHWMNEGAYSR